MWYFSWILGVGLAVGFGILNGMWHEFHSDDAEAQAVEDPTPVLVYAEP